MKQSKPWPFYVYELLTDDGNILYVGKGSGKRLDVQKKAHQANGVEVARFKKESDAYAYEVERIKSASPMLNKCAGGNGSRCTAKRESKSSFQKQMEAIGSKAMAARLWLRFAPANLRTPSMLAQMRAIGGV